jgi:hypothetical protein
MSRQVPLCISKNHAKKKQRVIIFQHWLALPCHAMSGKMEGGQQGYFVTSLSIVIVQVDWRRRSEHSTGVRWKMCRQFLFSIIFI